MEGQETAKQATVPAVVTPQATVVATPASMPSTLEQNIIVRIQQLEASSGLTVPKGYSAANNIRLAWLHLQEAVNRDNKPILEVCTQTSIAIAIMKMCIQGLSVSKKQVDFIPYGNKLTCQLEYHGTIALARRFGGVIGVPIGNVIYEGDNFKYRINPDTGKKEILCHEQDFLNIDNNKIIGAHATLQLEDGSSHIEIMNIAQIKQSWMQGPTKGQSPAHKNFPDQMCIKTVIARGCKLFITTSDDGGLTEEQDDVDYNEIPDAPKKQKQKIEIEEKPVVKNEPIDVAHTVVSDGPGF